MTPPTFSATTFYLDADFTEIIKRPVWKIIKIHIILLTFALRVS